VFHRAFDPPQFLMKRFVLTHLQPHYARGFIAYCSTGEQFGIAIFHVLSQLFDDFALALRRQR
jgi:hypothetical protein